MTDYSDPKQVQKQNKKISAQRDVEIEELRTVLATKAGRNVMRRILAESKFMGGNTFTGNSTTFYNLGQRQVGLWLYQEILAASPRAYLSMIEDDISDLEEQDNG